MHDKLCTKTASFLMSVYTICLLLLIFGFVFVISGCSTTGQPISATLPADSGAIHMDGTLSNSNDEVDGLASVVYTRLAAYRRNAAFLLRQKRISVSEAVHCQSTADSIRRTLDRAYAMRDRRLIETQRARIMTAVEALEKR